MYAVVVTLQIDPDHQAQAREFFLTNVVPGARQAPGIVSAYWLAPKDGKGLSFSVRIFQNEKDAQAAAQMIPSVLRSEYITVNSVEVREVFASFSAGASLSLQ